MQIRSGEPFGPFLVEEELGRGGMGVVFRATDTRLGRAIALKLISRSADGRAATPEAVKRLLREARAAAGFQHPGAVVIFEVGEIDDTPFIAMEFVEGATLREAAPNATLSTRLRWLVAVTEVLAAAHAAGIVHRDIKPDNVMVTHDGRIKLLDFGIARSAPTPGSGETPLPTITQEGVPVGTPQYMAPEQIQGLAVGPRSDQFSWAVMVYETLTGALPFDGPDLLGMTAAILLRDPRAPSTARPELAPADAVLSRALAKDPAARFDSIVDAGAALAHGFGIDVPSTGPTIRPVPRAIVSGPPSAHPLATTLSSDPMLANTVESSADVNAAVREPPRPPPRRRWIFGVAAALVVGGAIAGGAIATRTWDRGAVQDGREDAARGRVPDDAASDAIGIAVTDWPVPDSKNDEARRAYVQGLQAARNGSAQGARELFRSVVANDPDSAASAHLWLAVLTVFRDRAQARRELESARRGKSTLPARAAVVLDALDDLASDAPAGLDAASAKLERAVVLAPNEALYWQLLATVQTIRRDFSKGLASALRALSLDPKYGAAWLVKALILEESNRTEDALAAYTACLEAADAASCLAGRIRLLSVEGRCAEVQADAERSRARYPSRPDGNQALASLAAHESGTTPLVEERLAQARAKLAPKDAEAQQLRDVLWTAAIGGRFEDVLRTAAAIDARIAGDESLERHGEVALASVEALLELGRGKEAGRQAKAFLEKRVLYTLPPRLEDDPTPRLLVVAVETGALDRIAAETYERAWVASVSPDRTPRDPDELWYYRDAAMSFRAGGGAAAVAAAPARRLAPSLQAATFAGRAFLLAKEPGRAKAALVRARDVCLVHRAPFAAIRAHALLGEAYEAAGDPGAACSEAEWVLSRWGAGHAGKPRAGSTVERTLRQKSRLRCPHDAKR